MRWDLDNVHVLFGYVSGNSLPATALFRLLGAEPSGSFRQRTRERPLPGGVFLPHPSCGALLAVPCLLGLDELYVQRDGDIFTHKHTAGFQGGVPGEAEVLAVDLRGG